MVSLPGGGLRVLQLGLIAILFGQARQPSLSPQATAERKAQEDLALAIRLTERGWHDMAALQYLEFARNFPRHKHAAKALERAGRSFEVLKQYDRAVEAYGLYLDAYATEGNRLKVLSKLGEVSFEAKAYRQARMAYEELVRLASRAEDPDAVKEERLMAQYRIGWCYKHEGGHDRAIRFFRTFIVDNLDTSYELLPMAQVAIGQCYLDKGEYDEAIDEFKKTMTEFPKSGYISNAYLGMAECHLKAERYEDAAAAVDKYRNVSEGQDDPMGTLASQWILAEAKEKQGDYTGAAAIYQEVMAQRPGTPEAALARRRTGEIFSGSTDVSAMTPDALMGMAQFALTDEKTKQAFSYFQYTSAINSIISLKTVSNTLTSAITYASIKA